MRKCELKREGIPALYETKSILPVDQMVYAKITIPRSDVFWYVIEYDPETQLAYGVAHITDTEFGYFSLKEIAELPYPIHIDDAFEPKRLIEVSELCEFMSKFIEQ